MENIVLYDKSRAPHETGVVLGRGGEGQVLSLKNTPDLAVKLFHPDVLNKGARELIHKIHIMIHNQEKIQKKQLPVAWPRFAVFDKQGKWAGYAMPRGTGCPMQAMAIAPLQKESFPNLGRQQIATYLIDLIDTVEALHKFNIYLGDINLRNILVDPDTQNGKPFIIDCDSMQLTPHGGGFFPCRVGTPEFTAPEHIGKDFGSVVRTPSSDAYSLAILMFQCFMSGRHPFDQINGESLIANMVAGKFPYGEKTGIVPGQSGSIPIGPWYKQWSWLSYKLKDDFCKTFRDGASNPSLRTTLHTWKEHLGNYVYCINNPQYSFVDELQPAHAKPVGTKRWK